jgi:hypothetical protein
MADYKSEHDRFLDDLVDLAHPIRRPEDVNHGSHAFIGD